MGMTWLAILGGIIIVLLAAYAGRLLLLLRKQTQQQAQHQTLAVKKRNANIYENVNTLCLVGIQGQCDLSEISIRIYNIMDYVQGDERVDFDVEFPATAELYHIVKDMARSDARQALVKKERMKQNLARHQAEARLQDSIVAELKALQKRVLPLNDQIPVQVL
ncbi:DUF2489 domain-containing protein [Vibrio profundum]|uniref:DUF2489 domain-containing protein n=1 Tax=Vibrio profundum TaxID=2910247 RepID=UPI003D097EC8